MHRVSELVPLVGWATVFIAAISYAVAQWRRGSDAASIDAAQAWQSEADALRTRVQRLEDELGDAKEKNTYLEGQVAQLTQDRDYLKSLVSEEHLTAMTDKVIDRIAESEDRIAQGILTMTDAISKALRTLRENFGAT